MKSKFQKFNCFNHLVYLLVRLFCVDFMFVVLCFLMVVIFHFVTVCANVRYKCSLVVILYFCQWVSFTVRKLEIWLPIKYLRSIPWSITVSLITPCTCKTYSTLVTRTWKLGKFTHLLLTLTWLLNFRSHLALTS